MKEIPENRKLPADKQGKIVRFDYEAPTGKKYANIYLPFGYDKGGRYDILYMMHGGGDDQQTFFGGEGQNTEIKNALDHLIEDGEMRPVIIVMPTFYTGENGFSDISRAWDEVKAFPGELAGYLMPAVESAFPTFADSTDETGFTASRDHRAFGGFSMGGLTTWYVFSSCMRFFATFLPISGDSWAITEMGGGKEPAKTAAVLAESVKAQGFSADDFYIYAITGSEDIAEPNMTPMIREMREFTDLFGDNFVYEIYEGGVHDMKVVRQYMYNALPALYR